MDKKIIKIIIIILAVAVVLVFLKIVLSIYIGTKLAPKEEIFKNDASVLSIKGDLLSLEAAGAGYFDANGYYTGFCLSQDMEKQAKNIASGGSNLMKNCGKEHFCACADLKNKNSYCVDDSGYSKESPGKCETRCTQSAVCND